MALIESSDKLIYEEAELEVIHLRRGDIVLTSGGGSGGGGSSEEDDNWENEKDNWSGYH